MIEVILKEPVDNLGNRGDVVKVAPGYARNYLLPRKLALAVTEGNKRQIEAERKRAAVIEAQERTTAEALATRLGQVEVVVARRVGEKDTLYGSVTSADITEALARQGFEIDRRKVTLPEPLKHLGEFSVPVRLHREVTIPVKVLVVKEEVAQA
jgi:large subunit ribosomal protein L9